MLDLRSSFASRGLSRLAIVLIVALTFLMTSAAADFAVAATGDPLPGVDILVKKKPPDRKTQVHLGSGDLPEIPADLFGPGSEPFFGEVALTCSGLDEDCHSRIDYVEGNSSDVLQMEMVPLQLRSIAPISVVVDGVDSFFDIWVDVRAQGTDPVAPVAGEMTLPAGTVLDPGVSSFVVDSFFDVEYRITFTESGTGSPAGSPLVGNLRLDIQGVDVPVTRVVTSGGGVIALGYDGSSSLPVTYESAGTGLRLTLESIVELDPVATETVTLGALKEMYR